MKSDKEKFRNEFKKRLYTFTLRLIEFLDRLPKDDISKRLTDQLLRSGTSIMANYIEGYAASSKKDFINFFNIALKSANESKFWLCLLRDSRRIEPADPKWLLNELTEIANIFASSILTMRGKR